MTPLIYDSLYLRIPGILRFKARRMEIIWLASYPKSGNTWLRFFLGNFLHGPIDSTETLIAKMPDIHIGFNADPKAAKRWYVRTHLFHSPAHPGYRRTAGFIYVLRHPKDVLLSNLNYSLLEYDNFHVSNRAYIENYIRLMGSDRWFTMGAGSWPAHVESWLSDPAHPHLVLRYEDMLRDPVAEFSRVVEFIGEPNDRDRLELAIQRSSFEKLREIEEQEKKRNISNSVFGGTEKSTRQGLRFMSRGRQGRRIQDISPELADLDASFDARFAESMKKWGY